MIIGEVGYRIHLFSFVVGILYPFTYDVNNKFISTRYNYTMLILKVP